VVDGTGAIFAEVRVGEGVVWSKLVEEQVEEVMKRLARFELVELCLGWIWAGADKVGDKWFLWGSGDEMGHAFSQ
jgi:hypothetical protein